MEFLKLSNLVLGSIVIILIIVTITLGAVNVKKNQAKVKARISVRIISAIAKDLEKIIIYPNPFKPSEGHSAIIFSNLTKDVMIKIHSISGEEVYRINNIKGTFEWFVINNFGERLASGIYLCIIENKRGEKKVKKIAVIK